MNHIFIDYENLKKLDPDVLGIERTTFTVLFGSHNARFDLAIVQQLMALAGSVEFVRIEKAGNNAVDFALAYYLGRKVATEAASGAYFHIVSGDRDYEPLVEHLRSRHVHLKLHKDFTTVAAAIKPKSPPPDAAAKAPKQK